MLGKKWKKWINKNYKEKQVNKNKLKMPLSTYRTSGFIQHQSFQLR
jgi:hypothetical protein